MVRLSLRGLTIGSICWINRSYSHISRVVYHRL